MGRMEADHLPKQIWRIVVCKAIPWAEVDTGSFVCECGRIFRRHGDLIRHHNFCDTHTL